MLGTSLLWRSTVAFTYLKVTSAKCLYILPVVLVLLFWSWFWSWSCKQRSLSCYFGLGVGLKNLVLFTLLALNHQCESTLRFNGYFSRWTWMSSLWIFLELRMMEVVVTTGAIRNSKVQSNRHHHQQTITQFFHKLDCFLSPNQQCQSTEGKISEKALQELIIVVHINDLGQFVNATTVS